MWAQVEISDFQDADIASVTVTGSETGIAKTNDWSSQTASSTTDQTKTSERDTVCKDPAPRRNLCIFKMHI